jgi:glycosyltransferase involved in cell wall biosynthesis
MKKILFLVQLPPPIHGASIMNQHVINIFKDTSYSTKTIELRFVENVLDIGNISFNKIFKMFRIGFEIVKTMINFKPDIVYFTLSPIGGAFYRDVFYVVILKLFGVKILYHLHGKGIKENVSVLWKKQLYKFVFKNSFVIHLSSILEQDISGLGYKKIYFVPNGIEKLKVDFNIKRNNKIPKLLFLSNLTVSKGLFVLIEACKILKGKNLKFQLIIVGKEFDILEIELIKKIKDNGLEQYIDILGAKYGNEKYQILSTSDIFVFPTFYTNECFPLVLLEAMQFGLPIVSTFEGAIPEIVDDGVTGFLASQKDATVLADKIEILIKDKEFRKKMGKAGREKFLKKYTLDKFEQNMLNILKEII